MEALRNAGPIVRQIRYLVDVSLRISMRLHNGIVLQESVKQEGVVMQLDSTGIANDLQHETPKHSNQISPCLPAYSHNHLEKQHDPKERYVENVPGQAGDVCDEGLTKRTSPQSAVFGGIARIRHSIMQNYQA
jgi:hypothetical protein